MAFDFEEEKLVKELSKFKPKKVLVQLPEGVKKNALEISKIFDKLGIEVLFSGETCWGGCALSVDEAHSIKADLIVHYGHAPFIKTNFPVIYLGIKDALNLEPILKKSLSAVSEFKTVGFSCSVQHQHEIKRILKFYESHGKKIILSKKLGKTAYEGHIIGCQYQGLKAIEKKVDAFLILGNRFHSIGAALSVSKPVILLDIYNNEISQMTDIRDKILKERYASIEKFKSADNVGIIIGTKHGQKFGDWKTLVKLLKQKGKKQIIITMSEITPDKITNFKHIDAFIELACPRIALDDSAKYPKPILTFREALVALGGESWKDFIEKGAL